MKRSMTIFSFLFILVLTFNSTYGEESKKESTQATCNMNEMMNVEKDLDGSKCIELIIKTNNKVLPGAEISIEGIEESFFTYASGRVIIDNVQDGTYQYSIRTIGYNEVNGEITISNGSIGKIIELTKATNSIAKR